VAQLGLIPGISPHIAQTIQDHYPSFYSLVSVYTDARISQTDKEKLLTQIQVPSHQPSQPARSISSTVSERVYQLFGRDDPQSLVIQQQQPENSPT